MTTKKQEKKPKKKAKPKKPAGSLENGRPSKFTDEVIEQLTAAISIGASYELASLYAGISYPCFGNWMRQARAARGKDEAGEPLSSLEARFLKFLSDVEAASAEAGIAWQQVVNRASKVDPDIALQMLRLRFTGYSERVPVQFTADIDLTKLTNDQLQRIANGENPADVIASATTGEGTPATTPTAATGSQPAAVTGE